MTPQFKTCYGIDVNGETVIAVRSTLSGHKVEHEDVSPDRMASDRDAVAACLPAHECFARRLTAPFASVAKAKKVFPSILDIQLPFPIESCIYRFLDTAPAAGGQVATLAIAARHEDLSARIEKLKRVSIDPTHLDHEALALWTQSLEEAPLAHESVRVILYVGLDRSTLAVGRGARFIHGSGFRSGSRQFLDGASPDALGPFAARIHQILRAQIPDMEATPMQWAFAGAGLERLEAIKAALRLPESATFFTHKNPDTFLARGLAARVLTGGAYRCNLRADSFEHAFVAAERDRGRSRLALACLAAGLVLCAVNGAWQGLLRSEHARGQQAIDALARELSGLPRVPHGQEVVVVERALEERKPLVEPFARAFSPSASDLLAALMDQATRSHVTLDAATVGEQSVVLHGRAATWDDSDLLAGVLRRQSWKVSLEKGDAGTDEKLPFTIKAVL